MTFSGFFFIFIFAINNVRDNNQIEKILYSVKHQEKDKLHQRFVTLF